MFSFTIAPEGINYLGKHLAKEVKGFYTENYKIFMKEIKKKINEKIFCFHKSKEFMSLKCKL